MSILNRVMNVDVREKLRQEGVLDMMKNRQEKWKLRMEMSLEKLTTQIFVLGMEGKRLRRRSRLKRTNNFK